jgi:hypothetical protein
MPQLEQKLAEVRKGTRFWTMALAEDEEVILF